MALQTTLELIDDEVRIAGVGVDLILLRAAVNRTLLVFRMLFGDLENSNAPRAVGPGRRGSPHYIRDENRERGVIRSLIPLYVLGPNGVPTPTSYQRRLNERNIALLRVQFLNEHIANLGEEMTDMQADLNESNARVEELEETNEGLEETIENLKERKRELKTVIAELESSIEEMEANQERAEKKLRKALASFSKQQEVNSSLQDDLIDARKTITKQDSMIESLCKALEEAKLSKASCLEESKKDEKK